MALCLGCGVAGAFAASRGLDLTRIVVTGVVLAALAAATDAAVHGRRSPWLAGVIALAAVGLSAAFDGAWWTLAAGLLAALPFGLSALRFPRPAATNDALFSAVTGVVLGLFPAVIVLFVAALTALAFGRRGALSAATLQFAPYVAAFTLLAVVADLAISV